YDFRRPAKFSKEHLRTLEIIFEHYGRLLSNNLPIYLRKNVTVEVVNSETLTFNEFSNSLSNPSILGIINFQPLLGNIIMEIQAGLGFVFIDRMLGGTGGAVEKLRPFTDIELPLIEKLVGLCMNLMTEPWENVIELEPVIDRVETNPQFAQVISPTDMIALITLNITIGEVEGYMNICLPFFTLEPIMGKLNTKYMYSTMENSKDEDYSFKLESLVKRVDIPVRAVLGSCKVSVYDVVHLQEGDIIRLDENVDSEMHIYVGDINKFTALPGTLKDKYAVRVTSVIREEE
ncbi:MAG: flagellar motor switch protein FliM, partial [Lachnospiraceae bacterium]|nr:flagellar motor switch protein FliM [Lachnospiraceae bacterium]